MPAGLKNRDLVVGHKLTKLLHTQREGHYDLLLPFSNLPPPWMTSPPLWPRTSLPLSRSLHRFCLISVGYHSELCAAITLYRNYRLY